MATEFGVSDDLLVVLLREEARARTARRNMLANKFRIAAAALAEDDVDGACAQLHVILTRVDGESPPRDWMPPSPDKDNVHDDVVVLMALLGCP